MKVLKLREKLGKLGLLLIKHGDGWLVTDHGVKTPFEKLFDDLDAVQMWLDNPTRRLTEKEAELFEDEFTAFAEQENENWRK
jgi:hypothetical protein